MLLSSIQALVKVLLDKTKLTVFLLFGTSSFITFSPDVFLQYICIYELTLPFKPYISFIFIISAFFYIYELISFLNIKVKEWLNSPDKISLKYFKRHISQDEIGFLIEKFYDKNHNIFRKTGRIEITDGRGAELISNYIIYLSSTVTRTPNYIEQDQTFDYNLSSFSVNFLNKKLRCNHLKIYSDHFTYNFKKIF